MLRMILRFSIRMNNQYYTNLIIMIVKGEDNLHSKIDIRKDHQSRLN